MHEIQRRGGRAAGQRLAQVLAGAAVLALTLPTGSAQAADVSAEYGNALSPTVRSSCVIRSFTPNKIVVGASTVKPKFSVRVTGCTVEDWWMTLQSYSTDPTHNRLIRADKPILPINPRQLHTYDAGPSSANIEAIGAEDLGPRTDSAQKDLPFSLLRRSTFGSTFNATPEPVTRGATISLRGTLKRVEWPGGRNPTPYYAAYGKATVRVQFKPTGSASFGTVKTVSTDAKGKVATTVTAARSGTWRLAFPGGKYTASSVSKVDAVTVR
jgi:hypothetical protein